MSHTVTCPDCGSTRMEHHHGDAAGARESEREVKFAQVLNGLQWREKPLAPPRHRDDVVPND